MIGSSDVAGATKTVETFGKERFLAVSLRTSLLQGALGGALIVAVGGNCEEERIAASVALRRAGCSVELDVSGRDERSAQPLKRRRPRLA